MRTRFLGCAGIGLAFAAAACDGASPSHTAAPDGGAAFALAVQNADRSLRVVTQAVAVAMKEQPVRLAVRDEMRDSPWDVHQVSLQELVAGPAGAGLLTAAAAAAGESTDEFRARLNNLPDLDFYMPSRAQRRTWRGTAGVVVGGSVDAESGSVFAFGQNGEALPNALGAEDGNRPLLLIHPAEPRGRRNQPQPAGVGDVIQSAADGDLATQYTWTDASGRTTVINPAEVTGDSFSTASYGDSTYIDHAYFDTNDSGNDLELTFYAKFYRPDGSYLGQWTYSNYSFPMREPWNKHQPLLLPVLPDSSAAYIELRVREEDSWGNPDEWYGPRKFTWVDRGQVRRLDEASGATHIWADIALGWIRRSPSVFTSVFVDAVAMESGTSASTYAEPRDQYGWAFPSSSSSVSSWWTGNTYVASATSSGSRAASVTGNNAGNTTVYATINGVTGSGSVHVEEPWQNCDPNLDPMCPQ